MTPLLTIGMATYDDYDGVFFTIQSLRLSNLKNFTENVEFIVIDNNPTSRHGQQVKALLKNWNIGKYIPFTAKTSTSSRNEIFKHATGKYTLCLDSHVLLVPDALEHLLAYYTANPDTKNLIQGPLLYDDLKTYSTHFAPVWRDIMYGIWEKNSDAMNKGDPFEIPMMGLGLFSCKTSEWQGFNEKFKGFGGEEGYIHEKFRQAGGKCICLPGLKWNHRFDRPNGIPYPNILSDRIWNYFVGALELYKDPTHPFFQSIVDAFKARLPEKAIYDILEKAKNEQ